MYKSLATLLFEGSIVGIGLIVLFSIILIVTAHISQELEKDHTKHMLLSVFLSGAVFHLLCEASGINKSYSLDYCSIVAKNN
jgi:hypothetical protein